MPTRQFDPIASSRMTSCRLWLMMAAVACCTGAAHAQSDVISVTGLVRDFHKTDPIINTAPAAGNGHYAGNVASTLNANWLPTYTVPAALTALPSQGNVSFSGNSTLVNDLHCNTMSISGTLTVHGDRSVRCDGSFSMATHARINLAAGAKLTCI